MDIIVDGLTFKLWKILIGRDMRKVVLRHILESVLLLWLMHVNNRRPLLIK